MNVVMAIPGEVDFSNTKFLVVDSKPLFRDMAHAALTRLRTQEIKHAPDVNEAVTTLKRFGRQIGGLVCDWDLAPVGGLELLRMIRSRTMSKVSPQICAVILTGRVDATAMRAAMLLDVNGVAIAPLSMEKLMKTLSNAMSRTWTLQAAQNYLAVPAIEPPAAEGAQAAVPINGKEIWRRDADAAAGGHSDSAGSPAPKPRPDHSKELLNVRMCTLADVKSGVVLARDLKDREGQLLLKSGTDLSTSLLTRLKSVAEGHADTYHVWIGERRAAS
ncbi:MAG: response regulator [Rhodospirillaceae bacterium]|nr:MAG: response regulator [Rhodospirillaceae bacterium]